MQSPETKPHEDPAIKASLTLTRIGAEEATTIPPVRVPSRVYWNPTVPFPARADPAQVPMMLPVNAKNTLSLALALQAGPQSMKLLFKKIKRMKMKALPRAARDRVTRSDVTSGGVSLIFLKQIRLRKTAKQEPNKQTQEPPQASKQTGSFPTEPEIECLMTKLRPMFQNRVYSTVILTTCPNVILPMSAIITVSNEIEQSMVFSMMTKLESTCKA